MATSCLTGTCGTGGWQGPLPGDPDSSNSVISAVGVRGGIDVSWTYPGLNGHAVAHTLLYRGTSSEFSGAVEHKVVNGNFFHDSLDSTARHYYWIRFVSINGTIGELIGPASAIPTSFIGGIIEELTGQIDAGLLAQTLKNRLDQISILNENLLDEIFDRETGQTSLAQAIADAQEGVAEALTFITTEIASRVSADEALAEQLTIVAATLGDDYAAVTQAMQVQINALTGSVDAMYTAKVEVNGLIGGFGIHNNGAQVDAGFDVDRFWVGRTGPDKKKPFIISGGVVYINQAMIADASIDQAKIANASIFNAHLTNACIATANIGDGHITSAKIGAAQIQNAHIADLQVTRLKIGNQAVTIPAATSAENISITPNSGWQLICQGSIDLPELSNVLMNFSTRAIGSTVSGDADQYYPIEFQASVAGATIGTFVDTGSWDTVKPLAGGFVHYFQIYARIVVPSGTGSNGVIYHATASAVACMR